ncbi:hypothetical protein ADUPG1_013002, partial [Aduncisulcus paluster]
PCQ